MRHIIIESPFGVPPKADWQDEDLARVQGVYVAYARACCRAVMDNAEEPTLVYASHLYWPQFLNDLDPYERALGIGAGFHLADAVGADTAYFFNDFGITAGMVKGQAAHHLAGRPIMSVSLQQLVAGAAWRQFTQDVGSDEIDLAKRYGNEE